MERGSCARSTCCWGFAKKPLHLPTGIWKVSLRHRPFQEPNLLLTNLLPTSLLSLAERLRRLLALPPPPPLTNLSLLGLNWTLVREETLRRAPRGMGAGGDMQLSPRAKRIIDLAYDEARGMSQPNILPQHLLIGILRERDGVGAQALTRIGITLTTLRQWVQEPQSGVLLRSSALPEEAHEESLRPVEQDQNDPNSQTLLRPQQENQS